MQQHRFDKRRINWNGRECVLPALPNLADIHRLTPLELEARASSEPQNKGDDFSAQPKSYLTTMLIAYLSEAEKRNLYSAASRQRILGDFKNSGDWHTLLQNHANAPAPYKGTSGRQTNAARSAEVGPPRAPASMLWKMPDAPTWEMRDMTFQKFVDIFNTKNNIDNSKGFEPWESVMSFFKEYVVQHYTAEAGTLGVLKHVLHALTRTKLEKNIPGPVLAKHLRRLEADKLQESIADTKKRARGDGDDGGPSPGGKRIKVEDENQGFRNILQRPQLPANANTTHLPKASKTSATQIEPANGSAFSQTATDGARDTRSAAMEIVGPNKDGVHPSRSQFVSNPTLGPINSGINGALVDSIRPTSASPAPSASAWLQANLPNGPEGSQKALTPVQATNVLAAPSLPVGDGNVLTRLEMPWNPTNGLPSPTLARHKATKSLVRLEVILEGVMEDVNDVIAKAKEPGTTEVLTDDQIHLLGKLIYSHKSAMKELKVLQASING